MIKRFLKKLSVKKLIEDLEYWIFIGIGNDLLELKSQREEYSIYIEEAIKLRIPEQDIPKYVLIRLKDELYEPFFMRPTFWLLVKLLFKKW